MNGEEVTQVIRWFSVTADGKSLGVLKDSARTRKEIDRLTGLKGIVVKEATLEDYIKYGIVSYIPKKQLKSFDRAAKRAERKKARHIRAGAAL